VKLNTALFILSTLVYTIRLGNTEVSQNGQTSPCIHQFPYDIVGFDILTAVAITRYIPLDIMGSWWFLAENGGDISLLTYEMPFSRIHGVLFQTDL
jgi:hypothetical protein